MELAIKKLLIVLLSGGLLALGFCAAMFGLDEGTASAATIPQAAKTALTASSPVSAVVSAAPQLPVVNIGDPFTVTVAITTIQPSRAAQTGLSFNPDVVRCDEVREGGFFSDWAAANGASVFSFPSWDSLCDNAGGKVKIVGTALLGGGTGGPQGQGVFMKVGFTALRAGNSPLDLIGTKVKDNSLAAKDMVTATVNSQVAVFGPRIYLPLVIKQ